MNNPFKIIKTKQMKKLYLHPKTKQFVSKEIYFKFVKSKDFPKSPFSEKMK
tara:strand:- start:95 stop:247 length:153 start_codon:yes stop_codon:yes gene_type:complete